MSDALINGLAGAGGGIIAQLLTYPLQTVLLLSFLDQFLFWVFGSFVKLISHMNRIVSGEHPSTDRARSVQVRRKGWRRAADAGGTFHRLPLILESFLFRVFLGDLHWSGVTCLIAGGAARGMGAALWWACAVGGRHGGFPGWFANAVSLLIGPF